MRPTGCLRQSGFGSNSPSYQAGSGFRDCEEERRTLFEFRFNPDSPPVALDNLFADSKTDPGSRVLLARVQSLKNPEDTVRILWSNANAVVGHRKEPFVAFVL